MGGQSAVLNSVISLSLFEKIRCDQRLEEGEEGLSPLISGVEHSRMAEGRTKQGPL